MLDLIMNFMYVYHIHVKHMFLNISIIQLLADFENGILEKKPPACELIL